MQRFSLTRILIILCKDYRRFAYHVNVFLEYLRFTFLKDVM